MDTAEATARSITRHDLSIAIRTTLAISSV
jgi:hypothetical protein